MSEIYLDSNDYVGKHISEVLVAEGASDQQAQDLSSSMQALSAMHFARWGMLLDWTLTKHEYGDGFHFQAYARDNLCEISLTV